MQNQIVNTEAKTEPEYIRLPHNNARCPHTGLSRTVLAKLIRPSRENNFKPPVRSFLLKVKRGAIRGTRLIVYASLMDYLRSLEQMEKLCA
jgi:hypothetical protein